MDACMDGGTEHTDGVATGSSGTNELVTLACHSRKRAFCDTDDDSVQGFLQQYQRELEARNRTSV